MTLRVTVLAALSATLSGWSAAAAPTPAIEAAAHGAYVAAINSNDTDTLMADMTEDIVYQAPDEPEIAGKDAVRKWVAAYFDAGGLYAYGRQPRACGWPGRIRLGVFPGRQDSGWTGIARALVCERLGLGPGPFDECAERAGDFRLRPEHHGNSAAI